MNDSSQGALSKEGALELAATIEAKDGQLLVQSFVYERGNGYIIVAQWGKMPSFEVRSREDWEDRERELDLWQEWQDKRPRNKP